VLLTFDFDTKELPGFCAAAIKACWVQDKTITRNKYNLPEQKANLYASGNAREGFPSAFLTPVMCYSFHPDYNLQNFPFSLQLTV